MENTKLLVCEDEGILALDLCQNLEECGYLVTGIAGSGPEAIALATSSRPDLALMDVGLQGDMNGIEVAAQLRRSYGIPSIFLTGHSDMETFLAAKSTEPYGFLVKPVDPRELRRNIELALQLHVREQKLRAEAKTNFEQVQQLLKVMTNEDDVEDRKQWEGLLKVAGGTSHHLNNLLFAIQGNLEWLATCPTIGSHEKRYIAATLESCVRAGGFVRQLMWAGGQGKFQMKMVPVKELVSSARKSLTNELQTEVVIEFSNSDYQVLVSEQMVKEAIVALLRNADEASSPGQRISVSVFLVEEEQPEKYNARAKAGPYVAIQVKDHGKGIPEHLAACVPEPFFTTHDLSKRFGLGLSVVRGVCFSHDGWFTLTSMEGAGTTITMYLPAAVEATVGGSGTERIH